MITWAFKQYLTWHARRVLGSMWNPREAQTEAFERLRRLLRGSEVSTLAGFDGCRSLEDCRRLPTSDGESMKPLFRKVFERGAAAKRVFGRSRVLGFARTSGTLGEPKDVPVNQAYMASLDRTLLRMVASHIYTGDEWKTLLVGKRILLGSRPLCGTSPTGLPICDISGLIPTRTWWSTRWLYTPRHRDLWIQDWPEKAELILEQAHGKNVISISGIPALAMDFARRARAKYGVTHLDGVWPNLHQYAYGAVHLSPEQRTEMRRSWFEADSKLSFYETYFSTEGPLAFSFEPNEDGLALNNLENLYLFRPYAGDGSFLFAHELRQGESYSIHVTTPGGLVNYHMGDRIEVVSTKPLLIRVARREADEISMTGEKITLTQVDLALEAVGLGPERLGSHLPVVWVEPGERPRLVWGVPQMSGDLPADTWWAARLDDALCRLNVLYAEALVHEMIVEKSRVVFVPASAFESYRDSKLGAGQFKPKRIFNSRTEFSAVYRWEESPSSRREGGSAGS